MMLATLAQKNAASDEELREPSASTAFSPALINKLARERMETDHALATGDLKSATSTTREYAQRRLLATTPAVLDSLERFMYNPDPKIGLAATSKLADLSPATRPDLTGAPPTSDALPASAIEALLTGLRPFIDAVRFAHTEEKEATPARFARSEEPVTPAIFTKE